MILFVRLRQSPRDSGPCGGVCVLLHFIGEGTVASSKKKHALRANALSPCYYYRKLISAERRAGTDYRSTSFSFVVFLLYPFASTPAVPLTDTVPPGHRFSRTRD